MADTQNADESNHDAATIQVENETDDKHKKDEIENEKDKKHDEEHKEGDARKKSASDKMKEATRKAGERAHQLTEDAKKPEFQSKIRKIIYIILGVAIIICCTVLLSISVLGAVHAKSFDSEHSGRPASLIIITVFAAVAIALATYAILAASRNKRKPLFGIGIASVVLAIALMSVAASTLHVTSESEMQIARSLVDSFKLAGDQNPRHVKRWNKYQSELSCCGVYGPDDYRHGLPPYLPADVPASCCPDYDIDKTDLEQERLRLTCKQQRKYHANGCKDQVVTEFTSTSSKVLNWSITVIVLLVILGIFGLILSKLKKAKPAAKDDKNAEGKKSDDEKPENKPDHEKQADKV